MGINNKQGEGGSLIFFDYYYAQVLAVITIKSIKSERLHIYRTVGTHRDLFSIDSIGLG